MAPPGLLGLYTYKGGGLSNVSQGILAAHFSTAVLSIVSHTTTPHHSFRNMNIGNMSIKDWYERINNLDEETPREFDKTSHTTTPNHSSLNKNTKDWYEAFKEQDELSPQTFDKWVEVYLFKSGAGYASAPGLLALMLKKLSTTQTNAELTWKKRTEDLEQEVKELKESSSTSPASGSFATGESTCNCSQEIATLKADIAALKTAMNSSPEAKSAVN